MQGEEKRKVARAPGKVILSGEHAVLHKRPAIVMAINRFVTTRLSLNISQKVSFRFFNLRSYSSLTMRALQQLKKRIARDYQLFLRGERPICSVLKRPRELIQFAFSLLAEEFPRFIGRGVNLEVNSDIPVRCGLGSSAASLTSVCYLLASHFLRSFSKSQLHRLILRAENLQHGFSSGMDPYISLHGGCTLFSTSEHFSLPMPPFDYSLIYTGASSNSTGEAVTSVHQRFSGSVIWSEFEEATRCMERALVRRCLESWKGAIALSHQLLCKIQVVPQKVLSFITQLEREGGRAKICGSGAIQGQGGGIVLATGGRNLASLCAEYGYQLLSARGEASGVQLV